jgi:exopolysaccharide production protein ExoZ
MATNPLLLEFAAGTLLGAAWCRNTLPAPAAGWLALAAGLASLAAWQICRGTEPTTWRAAIWGIPAALTVLGAVTIERHRPIPALRPLLLLGDASFSIYLLNVFVAAATWRALGATSPILYAPVALGLSAAAGIVFWRVAERPLTRRTRHWLHRPMMLAATRPPPVHETTLPGR